MPWTKVPDKQNLDPFTEIMWDTYVRDNFNAGCVSLIAAATPASAATITFSSIPQTYEGLLLVYSLRNSNVSLSSSFSIIFNNDSTAIYYSNLQQNTGTTASASETLANATAVGAAVPAANATANERGFGIIFVDEYAKTDRLKHIELFYALKTAQAAATDMITAQEGGLWNSAAAINRVQFISQSIGATTLTGNISLYGVA